LFADMLALSGGRHGLMGALRCANLVIDAFVFGRSRHLVLDIDGVRHEGEVLYVTVANTPLVGYNIPIAPTAKPADAQLDLVVVGALTRTELLTYWRAVRRRAHLELPKVAVRRAREVRIAAGGRWSHVVHVDERANARTPVTIRIAPGALKVLLPIPPERIAS
jgi:diacylglycerol kinase (ATP)